MPAHPVNRKKPSDTLIRRCVNFVRSFVIGFPLCNIAVALCAISVLSTAHAGGGDRGARDRDVWQSPRVARERTTLPRARRDTGPTMPLMEISLIARACRRPAFQSAVGMRGDECAKAMFQVKRKCTQAFHRKFPRGDNREIDGRLTFKKFFSGYEKCLRTQYAKRLRRY
jgi:hypothetical protein